VLSGFCIKGHIYIVGVVQYAMCLGAVLQEVARVPFPRTTLQQ